MLKQMKCWMGIGLVAILLVVSGCSENAGDTADKSAPASASSGQTDQTQITEKNASKEQMKIYFPNEDGTKLVAKSKPAAAGTGTERYAAVVKALLQGTSDAGTVSVVPAGTKLNGITVKQGVAYVDFSKELVKKFNGGSAGEIMLVGSIVNTLTEFSEIHAVQIMVDGKIVETIAGHMDTSEPLKRFKDI